MKLKSFSDKSRLVCPIIKVNKPDIYYSRLILSAYAGKNSELTSISDYLSQSIDFEKQNKRLSVIFEKLASDEMNHFRILGELICKLGGTPSINLNSCYTEEYNSENTDNIKNNKKIIKDETIKYDILKEKESVNEYLMLREAIDDNYVRDIIDYIISDEKKHIDILYTI